MKEFSFPKKIILRKKKDFGYIISEGKTLNSSFFRVFHISEDDFKVGFAVQKGYKNKVVRNCLKRKLKELWRFSYKDYYLSGKNVIIIKQKALKSKFDNLNKDLRSLLEKLENISK